MFLTYATSKKKSLSLNFTALFFKDKRQQQESNGGYEIIHQLILKPKLLQERIEQLRQKYGKTEGGESEREDGGGAFQLQLQHQGDELCCGRRQAEDEEEEGVLGCEREEGEHNSLLFLEQEIEPSEVRR